MNEDNLFNESSPEESSPEESSPEESSPEESSPEESSPEESSPEESSPDESSNQLFSEINIINDIDFDSNLDNLGFLGISLFIIIFFLGVSFILRED